MVKKKTSESNLTPEELLLAEDFLRVCQSKEELRDWILTFLDIDFPSGWIDPESNSSPIDWMYEAYSYIRDGRKKRTPSMVVYSARECYKTLSMSCYEFVVMCHFGITVSHMAAIKNQSEKAVSYVTSYLRKCRKYIEHHGRSIDSQAKSHIKITENEGDESYLKVIVCTMAGANGEHTLVFCADELDVVQYPHAFEEAKLIPGPDRGRMPLTIFTSTRKFAFGLMQKEIENAEKNERPIRHWNIIDVTEKCQPNRHRPEEPKVKQYISRSLPLKQITPKAFEELKDEDKGKYEAIDAYAGCLECPLLPVCKTRLANRPEADVGGLYKSIDHVINTFKSTNPDIAEAQLMCWKPGSLGVIYGRFDMAENTLTVEQAYRAFTGDEPPPDLSLSDLIEQLHRREIPFYVGGDWGYRHNYALIASAMLPNGDWWLFETFAMSELEFEDQLKYAKIFRDKYRPKRWFMDPAYPGNLKTFTKNGMPCKDFKKDIMFGIESVRGQVVNATNRRRLRVILSPDNGNDFLVSGFRMHHFMTDAQGRITTKPDDEEFADVMDSLRYLGQNLFPPKKHGDKETVADALAAKEQDLMIQRYLVNQHTTPQQSIFSQMVQAAGAVASPEKGKSKSGRVIFDFSGPE